MALVVALKVCALLILYAGWKFAPRADHGADLWMTRPDTSFMDNLANFDGAWFVRLAALGYDRLASGDYDLDDQIEKLRVMDPLGYRQGLWPPEPGVERFDRGYGFRHWPGMVWLLGLIGRTGLDYVYAGVVLSNLFTIVYGLLLYFLARKDMGEHAAVFAVALSQFHPGGYSLSGLYNESMFLALAAGAMLSARQGRWWLCGALGMLCALTRIFGVVLAVPLLYEWLEQRSESGGGYFFPLYPSNLRRGLKWLFELPGLWWALLIPAGSVLVLIFFNRVSGDPLIFTRVHEANVYGHINWPWLMLAETWHKGWQVWMKELPLHALLLAVLLLSFRRVRGSYWVWMLAFFLYHTSNGNHSYLRYQVQCLPMFLAIASVSGERGWVLNSLLCLFAGLFGLFSAMFINGYWVA